MKIRLDHVTKKFVNRNRKKPDVVAVSDFTFDFPDGELIGLLGPSGCGKSTALNLISGLEFPTEGRIYFDDEDVTELQAQHRGVGLVFQNYALYPHLTVLQNIIFPLQNLKGEQRMSKEQMEHEAKVVASLVQIEELMDRRPSELSGGQQQRVAIARALVKKPRVLLLDEPLSNLDARLRLQTREEIRRIQMETGITTVFVTHDQEEAMSISDHIVLMKNGIIQQIGEPQEIYDDPANLFVAKFLGNPQINVFYAEVKNGMLYIGNDPVMEISGVPNHPVYAGIRPEGFILREDGSLVCRFKSREVMGRDTSIVAYNQFLQGQNMRVIVGTDCHIDKGTEIVRFALVPEKVRLFEQGSEERIVNG